MALLVRIIVWLHTRTPTSETNTRPTIESGVTVRTVALRAEPKAIFVLVGIEERTHTHFFY
jgi:hypothetical protein